MCKKLAFLVSFALVLSLFLSSVTKGYSLNDPCNPDLVSWWKLNEGSGSTALDSSYAAPGTGALHGPIWVSGHIGSGALSFDGINDYVDCGNSTSLQISAQITMACWVKLSTVRPTATWEAFLSKGDGCYRMSRSQTGGTAHMGFNNSSNIGWFDSITEVNDGTWHHVAGTFDGNTARLYIDGNLDNSISTPIPVTITTDSSMLWLGDNSSATTRYLHGTLDDMRLYKRALKGVEIPVIMYGEWYPFAYDPEPADETVVSTRVVDLSWKPGDKVASTNGHKVYLDPTKQKVIDRSSSCLIKTTTTNPSYQTAPLAIDTTYYWAVDEVNDGNNWSGSVWSFDVAPYIASHPDPCDGAKLVEPPIPLKWAAGVGATEHHVYFGDNYDNVNAGTGDTDKGTVTEPNFSPGTLEAGKTYFWKIDEANDTTTYPGNVWSFTTTGPLVGLRSEYYNTTDLSGPPTLVRKDLNINFDWANGAPDPTVNPDFSVRWTGELEVPETGTYTFTVTYMRAEDSVRLSVDNRLILNNWAVGSYLTNGTEATIHLAKGQVPFQMEHADYSWAAIAKLSWEGPSIPLQIVPRGQFTLPLRAVGPKPFNGDTQVSTTPTLSWIPGVKAASHDVYFSDKWDDVNDANNLWPVGTSAYKGNQPVEVNYYKVPTPPAPLEWGKTYYWRIDEINDLHPDKIWRGGIRNFTTLNCLVVDDFEDYNDTLGHTAIWEKWIANSTGKVGYSTPSYAEKTIVHRDNQSMPFDYNNIKSPYDSNATRTFDTDQNWVSFKLDPTHIYPLKSLTLWFRGYPAPVDSFVESPTGTYTITTSGADIGNVSPTRGGGYHDELYYVYKKITAITNGARVEIVAKVEALTHSNTMAKAGVMFRNSLDPNSTEGMTYVMPLSSNAGSFRYRLTTGGSTGSDTETGITDPCWVKLTITYSSTGFKYTLRGYHSTNGTAWYGIGAGGGTVAAQTITAGSLKLPLYIGLAVTARDAAGRCTAKFSNVSTNVVGTATISPATWSLHQNIGIKSNVAAPLYVTLQDSNSPTAVSKKVTHPDPNIILQTGWQEWNIALSDFTGVDLTKVKKITLGVGSATPSGTGTLYFDDIRVYVPRCVANRRAPDLTGTDCLVNYEDLQILTNNWLVSDYQVTAPTEFYPDTDPCLEAWYKFENNLDDSSTHSRTGDPCGTMSYAAGKAGFGQAISLNGLHNYVVVTRPVQDDFTLMAWIKPAVPGAFPADTRAYQGDGLIWSDVGGGAADFIMSMLGKKLAFATGPNDADTTSSRDIMTGQWVHVAATRKSSSGQVKLYIDGLLDTTAVHSNIGPLNANAKIEIGGNSIDNRYYVGLIDDVRIYSRALADNEVAQVAGKPMPFMVPLKALLTPQNTAINLYEWDSTIELKDYARLAEVWGETLQWPVSTSSKKLCIYEVTEVCGSDCNGVSPVKMGDKCKDKECETMADCDTNIIYSYYDNITPVKNKKKCCIKWTLQDCRATVILRNCPPNNAIACPDWP